MSLLSYSDDVTRSLSGSNKSCFTDKELSSGRVTLLIDGLDEVASDADRTGVLTLIDDFLITHPACQVVLTSRPYRFVSELPGLKKYEEFRISPINWKQAEKIVHRVTEGKKVSKPKHGSSFVSWRRSTVLS